MPWRKHTRPTRADTGEALVAFLDAPDWAAAWQVARASPEELLSPAADQAIAYTLKGVPDDDVDTRTGLEQCRTVLAQCRRDGISATFGDILYNLGNRYRRTMDGDRAANLGQAIRHYKLALDAYDRTADPVSWATAAGNLAAAYLQRADFEKGDNRSQTIELAIGWWKTALGEPGIAEDRAKRASFNFNLGSAYEERVAGDRAGNLEEALAAYTVARMAKSRDDPPVEWAMLYCGLGRVYQQRVYEDRSGNLEAAINNFEQALQVTDPAKQPFVWGQVHLFLADAYQERIEQAPVTEGVYEMWPGRGNLEQARKHYEQALTLLTLEKSRDLWATAHGGLANVYLHRKEGDRAENVEQAIAHGQLALQGITAADAPSNWAILQSTLGLAYAARSRGKPEDKLRQAVACYQEALSVADRLPLSEVLPKLGQLGHLKFAQGDWGGALDAYERAIDADQTVLAGLQDQAERRAAVGNSGRIYAYAAYCYLKLGRPGEALTRLEQGKTRLLADILAYEDIDPTVLSETDRAAFVAARRRLDALIEEQRLPLDARTRRDPVDLLDQTRLADGELRRVIHSLRTRYPDFMPTSLTQQQILALTPEGGAMVALVFSPGGSMAVVIPCGLAALDERHVIDLKGFTDGDLADLMFGSEERPGWLQYSQVAQRVQDLSGDKRRAADTLFDWSGLIREMTGRMWDPLMGPILQKLRDLGVPSGAELVIFTDDGCLLPLHAACGQEGGQPQVFLDDYAVSYAPSAYLLWVTARHRRRLEAAGGPPQLCAVIDPTADLRFAPVEADGLLTVFPPERRQVLTGPAATREAVLRDLPGARYVHIACHGVYDWSDAEASALTLADGEQLSEADVAATLRLDTTRLVVLSACETGVSDVYNQPDEYAGFPTSFLRVGAAGVLATMWAVPDISTAVLLARFYKHHLADGLSAACALRAAQHWIRTSTTEQIGLAGAWERVYEESGRQDADAFRMFRRCRANPGERPFEDPYFWAGFNLIGT